MRDPVEEITGALGRELVDEDGDRVVLEIEPGLAPAEIDAIGDELGAPLPGELRRLLELTVGFDGPLDIIDFTGRSLSFGDDEIFPFGHPIAGDGYGNHWVLDVSPEGADVAPVFYACHDPPVVVYQSPGLGDFLHEVFRMYEPPHTSLVNEVHEKASFTVWGSNPGELDRAAALAGDDELRGFAESLDDRYVFVDLRRPEIGDGFSWGRFGPRTVIRRHGRALLFAYARPEKGPGLFARLLGR